MKKIFISLLAVAAVAACAKTEVAYDAANEIGFAPAVKTITKAAMSGTLPTTQDLGIWAYWNGVNGTVESNGATYANYTDAFLANALFGNRNGNNWGGKNEAYPWPTNGALVFAGYTVPSQNDFAAAYNLEDNKMTFTGYTQSTDIANTFDLCWFGRTANSYNNRATGAAVDVTLSHALTWITIQIKGDTNTAGNKPWRVTKATLLAANTVGTTGTCVYGDDGKAKATWTSNTPADVVIKAAAQDLKQSAEDYESTAKGVVVIPQTPVKLEVEYEYPVGNEYKPGKSTIDLTLTNHKDENGQTIATSINEWASGVHYTYTLVFKANEILVAPTYGEWANGGNQTVVVE